MTKTNLTQVDEFQYGVYVWRTEDGRYVGDDEGNYMLIASKKNDAKNISALESNARRYGITGGSAEFRSGVRPVSDNEYEDQVARRDAGLVPDPYDLGSLMDDYHNAKAREGK